jgi:antitoxin VapB
MPKVEEVSSDTKRAALFRNGRNQALRIPCAFELPGKEVMVHREGERLIIEPVAPRKGLLALLAELKPMDIDFFDVDDGLPPLDDVEL